MSAVRRFLLSSSFARLIMRQRSFSRIVQGHFPISHERLSFVHFEEAACQLVLVTKPDTEWEEEERTEVAPTVTFSPPSRSGGHYTRPANSCA
jgi:hypothetical protein